MENELKCENCTEWEYFEGYGYGCFCMKTMTPIDASKCENYVYKWANNIPYSWKPKMKGENNDKD